MHVARIVSIFTLLSSGALMAAESGSTRFVEISRAQAEREAGELSQQVSAASMWIWSDRYVYRPGESLTLRWTIKPNDDLYPYTIVAFRQNNQTGARTYFPGGTGVPTDIFGNTVEQGFRVLRAPSATKAVLIGNGGSISGQPMTVPEEFGMHTLVVQLRDYTGTRVVKAAYWKIGIVESYDNLTGNIDSNRTLTNRRAYLLSGVVAVRNGAVLTIEPGTFIFGQTGSQPPSVLLITRNGRINASGTKSRPIIMTSRTPESPVGSRRRGDWGGLLLIGGASGNVPAEQSFIEGLPQNADTQWGGTDDAHNCGTLRYVRSEYAGVQLAPNNETNGIVWAGCGSGTVAEYLQSHYGNDDAFEWFGGTANAKYLVATYAEDDNLDFQLGWRGNVQYAIVLQNPTDRGNRGIEGDNSEFDNTATPFSNPTFYNLTLIGSGAAGSSESDARAIYLRRGARTTINNSVVMNWGGPGLAVDTGGNGITQANIDNNTIRMNGVLLWKNNRVTNGEDTIPGNVSPADVTFAQGSRGDGKNFVVADPRYARPLEFSDPNFAKLLGSVIYSPLWIAPPDNGFFDQTANFIGAIGPVDWTEEWTNFHMEQDVEVQ